MKLSIEGVDTSENTVCTLEIERDDKSLHRRKKVTVQLGRTKAQFDRKDFIEFSKLLVEMGIVQGWGSNFD